MVEAAGRVSRRQDGTALSIQQHLPDLRPTMVRYCVCTRFKRFSLIPAPSSGPTCVFVDPCRME